ncbi:MAG: hypothetical protein FWC92_08505 [Defluviitaleaceae bacterium]|nr:hypothetical protein [Defluviitaleaceae bacterium]
MLKWLRNKLEQIRDKKRHNRNKQVKEKVWRINPLALGIFIARRVWFFGVFIYLARFVSVNWDKCVDFSRLTGYNLLFVIFVLMLLLPLLTGLKVSALGVGMEATAKTDSSTDIAERIKKEAIAEDTSSKGVSELVIKLEAARDKTNSANDSGKGR